MQLAKCMSVTELHALQLFSARAANHNLPSSSHEYLEGKMAVRATMKALELLAKEEG